MFTTPTMSTRYATWPRYNSDVQGPPSTPSFTHQQPVPPLTNSTALSSSSPTLSSPVIQTPFTFKSSTYASSSLFTPSAPESSPTMPSYPDTPSPPSTYGINGLVIGHHGSMMSNMQPTSCIRLVPAHDDPFTVPSHTLSKQARPVLRPSLSHNGAYQHPPSQTYPRTMPTKPTTITTSTPRPSTAGGILDNNTTPLPAVVSDLSTSAPSSAFHFSAPPPAQEPTAISAGEASTTSGNEASTSTAPYSTQPTPPASYSHHQQPQPLTIQTNSTPYSDDHSFSTSYSYDTSFSSASSGSPWMGQHAAPHPPPMVPSQYYPHPMYEMYAGGKQMEPILAPGEIPAPRPPMSYAALIGEALLLAPPPHHLYVAEISESIKKRYAYYRQNPSKIYNGVRHQTSMCKAFVKLPRPFGDQSGGARRWAIRSGCESWFSGGGYHPPTSSASSPTTSSSTTRKAGGKAKATARSKQLAIGTSSPPVASTSEKKSFDDSTWSPGPSSGPAFDGTGRPFYPYAPAPPPQYAQQPPGYAHHHQHLAPGYHLIPIAGHPTHPGHPTHQYAQSPQHPIFMQPMWPSYASAPPPPPPTSSTGPSSAPTMYSRLADVDNGSPDHWREDSRAGAPSEHGSHGSYEDRPMSPASYPGTSHGASPDGR